MNKYKQETFKKDTSDLRKKRFEAMVMDLLLEYFFKNVFLNSLNIMITKVDISKDLRNCKIFYLISEIAKINDNSKEDKDITNISIDDIEQKIKNIKRDKNVKDIQKILKINCISIANFLFKEMNLKGRIFLDFRYDDAREKAELINKIFPIK